ncbi:hypothetical protein [Flaviaesturariibacter amylovorans]|uniref:DUF4249 domain-containing protein n=1 Tax=Flaviaesturariibacter amylovorans TaxID=1084520 RepID=A0ABP8GGR6_9BACT
MKVTLPSCCGLLLLLGACTDKKDEFVPETPAAYVQLAPGKYITYLLDSTVFVQSGRVQENHRYQEKHTVDAQVTDALSRPSWRIFRSLRDSAGTRAWEPAGTYLVTLTNGTLERIEDNMRTVRLATPVTAGTSWKGHRFLATEPYTLLYNFSNDDAPGFGDWDFTIASSGESVAIRGQVYENVATVNGVDESLNVPITIPTSFGYRSFLTEQWARGVGMIYQNYILWEYQPNPNGTPYRIGFGVERSIIDHN